jgi:hypothetical protein
VFLCAARNRSPEKPADKEKFERNEKKLADAQAAFGVANDATELAIKDALDKKCDMVSRSHSAHSCRAACDPQRRLTLLIVCVCVGRPA